MELEGSLFTDMVDIISIIVTSIGFWGAVVIICAMYLYHKRWIMKYKLYPTLDKKKMKAIDKTSLGGEWKFPRTGKMLENKKQQL